MMEGEDLCAVLLGDNVELERHGEMPYIDDTEWLGYVPDSYEDLSAKIVDDSLKDYVPDSEEEDENAVVQSPMKKMEVTRNKWKANTLVYRRRRSKNVAVAEQSSIQSISSARKAIREERCQTITLAYRRRRHKNVAVGEHSSIQSLSSARTENNEEHSEAEKCISASSHAPKIGILTLEEEMLHYGRIVRMNLDVDDADRFASSHYETDDGEKEVSTPVLQSKLEIGSDSDSQGPEEPSPEKALDFVDHFLSENSLSISGNQKTEGGKADPIRSPPGFSAKGALALARRASLSNKPRELKIFDWTAEETTGSHSFKGADKELNSKSRGQLAEKDEGEAVIADTFDDGFNTQMAAEVMEALIHAHPPTTILQDTHEPQFCKNLKMPGSVPPISTNELETMNTFPSLLNGDKSRPLRAHSGFKKECKSQKQWKDSIVCREPLATKSVSSRRTPLTEKKVVCDRNVRLLSQQKVDGNSEIEGLAGGRGKRDSLKFTQCQQSMSTTKRNKRKPSERLSEVSKNPVKCSRRSISNYLDLAVPKKRRTGKFRDSRSNGLLWTTSSTETQPEASKCSLFGPGIPFKLDPLCYMKKKRTHRGVPLRSIVSLNSSTLPSGKSSKQKAEQKTMPGLNNCGCVHMDRDRKASNCSRKGDIMVSKENVNLNVVGADSDVSRTSKKHGSSFFLAKEVTRLGCAESLPNFFPKKLRRRKNENVCVLLSQHLESKILNQQKKIIARLGFSVASCCSDATHFVTDRFVRTRNMLEAISLGKPVVTHYWLKSCDQANYCVDEERYILRDVKKEKEIGFSMALTLASASKNPLLMGRRVFITPNVQPCLDLIQSLVKSVHGKVVGRIAEAEKDDGCIPKDLLILSCEEDYAKCVPLIKKGAAIYDSELLLNGIIIHKLEFERHQLFIEYAQSIGSKKRPISR